MAGPTRLIRPQIEAAALVVAVLVVYLAAVYLVLVVGGGLLLPDSTSANLALTFLAAALVAVTLKPIQLRVRQWLPISAEERLLRLTTRHDSAEEVGDGLEQMARLLTQALGAVSTQLTVYLGADLRITRQWPHGSLIAAQVTSAAGPTMIRQPLLRKERQLGELIVRLPGHASLTPVEYGLLDDAANHAALIVEATRMDQTLRDLLQEAVARNHELERSRRRVLTVMEDERRRIERDIHDGSQQQLVALAVNLRLLRVLTERDPDRARTLARSVRQAAADAIATLEELSRGMCPALLIAAGPAEALTALTRSSPVPVTVRADSSARLTPEIERTIYFCCIEALQNAVKHANASQIAVTLTVAGATVSFEVNDDGSGFDPDRVTPGSGTTNMRDRLASVGGTLSVTSRAETGTSVVGWIPVPNVASPGSATAAGL